jgi:hypothetical protein
MAVSTQPQLSILTNVFFPGRTPTPKTVGENKQLLTAFGNVGSKKKRSGEGYDKSVNLELVFWEDIAESIVKNVKHGDRIEITAGYLRSTIDTYATDQLVDKLATNYTGDLDELRTLVEVPKIELTVQDFKKINKDATKSSARF